MLRKFRKKATDALRRAILDHYVDRIGVVGKNIGFMDEHRFAAAWAELRWLSREGYIDAGVPDIRWRAHICCWAAMNGLGIEGDFVECGVNTGLLSVTIAKYIKLEQRPKHLYLFDTFAGVPNQISVLDPATGIPSHVSVADAVTPKKKPSKYFDVFWIAARNFAPYPNAHLVRGVLPATLAAVDGKRISYLSVDLNNAPSERAVIERLWSQLTPGAVVVIDDYAWKGYEEQYRMWNAFADEKGKMVATLPTGQGLLIR